MASQETGQSSGGLHGDLTKSKRGSSQGQKGELSQLWTEMGHEVPDTSGMEV